MKDMLKNKKAGGGLVDNWAEIFTVFLLFIGLMISLLSDSAVISYIVITICGFIVGRMYYLKKAKIRFPFYMIVFGFLVGFTIGIKLNNRGKFILIILFFVIGCYIGYYLHEKKYLRS